jgi:hypothetical protein
LPKIYRDRLDDGRTENEVARASNEPLPGIAADLRAKLLDFGGLRSAAQIASAGYLGDRNLHRVEE